MLERRVRDSVVYYASPLLEAAGVPHGFSTRLGGVSEPPFDSMNLGTLGNSLEQDAIENIRENQRRFRAAIGCATRESCNVHQVHGRDVLLARPGEPFENGRKADAIASDDPSRLISVKYADCVPILLASTDGRAVAAVHAGWRGIVAEAPVAAVTAICRMHDHSPRDLLAAIGPSIGFDAFEVGVEVLLQFGCVFGKGVPARPAGEKGYIDLREAVRLELIEAGIPNSQIDTTDRCTFRDASEFFSHRRDHGITGRMAAYVGARGDS